MSMCKILEGTGNSVYARHNLWRDAEFPFQKGFDGSFAQYFSGELYILSADLVREIVSDGDSVFAGIWASHLEDAQVGRWVKMVAEKRDKASSTMAPIEVIEDPRLVIRVPKS